MGSFKPLIIFLLVILILFGLYCYMYSCKKVTNTEGYDTFEGSNHVFVVTCAVAYEPPILDHSWTTVVSTFSGQGKSEEQGTEVYLTSGESKTVEFKYDISSWKGAFNLSSTKYECHVYYPWQQDFYSMTPEPSYPEVYKKTL